MLRGQGRSVDTDDFDAAMARQREDARRAWQGSGETADAAIWFDLRERTGPNEFLGYTTVAADGEVQALVVDGASVERAEAGTEVSIVLNQSPFYGEAGGQVGDVDEPVPIRITRGILRVPCSNDGQQVIHV